MECDLEGRTVAILRPRGQSKQLAELVVNLGGTPVIAPAIEIRISFDNDQVTGFFDDLSLEVIHYLIFTSVNGVNAIFHIASELGRTEEFFDGISSKCRVVAIGSKTYRALEERGIMVEPLPQEHSSRGLLNLFGDIGVRGRKIVLLRAASANPLLATGLDAMGAHTTSISIYQTDYNHGRVLGELITKTIRGELDVMIFTSPSIVDAIIEMAHKANVSNFIPVLNNRVIVASIGPVTGNTLRGYGVKVDVESKKYSVEGLMDGVVGYFTQ